eukprot:PhM_4_TR8591/c0_g1_i1/m.13335
MAQKLRMGLPQTQSYLDFVRAHTVETAPVKKVLLAPGIEATARQAELLRAWTGPGYYTYYAITSPAEIPNIKFQLKRKMYQRHVFLWRLRSTVQHRTVHSAIFNEHVPGVLSVLRHCPAPALISDGEHPQIIALVINHELVSDKMGRGAAFLGDLTTEARLNVPVPRVFDVGTLTQKQQEEYEAEVGNARRLVRLPKTAKVQPGNFYFPEHAITEHHMTVEFSAKILSNLKLALKQEGTVRAIFPTTGRMRVHHSEAYQVFSILQTVATDTSTAISVWDEKEIRVTVIRQVFETSNVVDASTEQIVVCVPHEHQIYASDYVSALGLTQEGSIRPLGNSGWVAVPTNDIKLGYEPGRVTVNSAPLVVITWAQALERV